MTLAAVSFFRTFRFHLVLGLEAQSLIQFAVPHSPGLNPASANSVHEFRAVKAFMIADIIVGGNRADDLAVCVERPARGMSHGGSGFGRGADGGAGLLEEGVVMLADGVSTSLAEEEGCGRKCAERLLTWQFAG